MSDDLSVHGFVGINIYWFIYTDKPFFTSAQGCLNNRINIGLPAAGPPFTRCNPRSLPAVYGRSVGFFTLWNHRNIAPGAQPALAAAHDPHRPAASPYRGNRRQGESPDSGKPILKNFGGLFCVRSIPSPDGSELYLCPTTCGLSDKGARPAGRVRRSRVAPLSIMIIGKER